MKRKENSEKVFPHRRSKEGKSMGNYEEVDNRQQKQQTRRTWFLHLRLVKISHFCWLTTSCDELIIYTRKRVAQINIGNSLYFTFCFTQTPDKRLDMHSIKIFVRFPKRFKVHVAVCRDQSLMNHKHDQQKREMEIESMMFKNKFIIGRWRFATLPAFPVLDEFLRNSKTFSSRFLGASEANKSE